MNFFTSDYHLNHAKILTYSNRPFKHVDEMNETIINNINSKVSKKDHLYFLGDIGFGDPDKINNYLRRISCDNMYWILGNHDRHVSEFSWRFKWVKDYAEVNIQGQPIIMSHYAFRVWSRSHYGSWNLYGHSHGSLPDDKHALAIDVGVDCHNFYPISFDEVKTIMSKKVFKPVDHHGKRGEGH